MWYLDTAEIDGVLVSTTVSTLPIDTPVCDAPLGGTTADSRQTAASPSCANPDIFFLLGAFLLDAYFIESSNGLLKVNVSSWRNAFLGLATVTTKTA